MKNYKRLSAILISSLLIFSSCSTASSDKNLALDSYASAPGEMVMDEFYYAETELATEAADMEYGVEYKKPEVYTTSSNSNAATKNDLSERKIIKNASINFETTEFNAFKSSLSAKLGELGGYVENSESYGDGIESKRHSRSSFIVAKVPAENYDKFMSGISELGNVTYLSERQQDATASYIDTESRIKSLQAEYDALLAILEKATELSDVISLQSRISEVTYQLESYKSTLRKYDNLIAYCTVNINITEVIRETVKTDPQNFGERIKEGLSLSMFNIRTDLSDFSVWFITSLPYIIIWAVVIAIIVLVIRVLYKRSKAKKEKKRAELLMKAAEHNKQYNLNHINNTENENEKNN